MTKNLKISLLVNSHTFIEEALQKAVLADKEPIQWKYAIFSLVQSIELILKERLRREHDIFIYQNIDNPRNTVGLVLAIERLKKVTSIQFSKNDLTIIQNAKKWRNLIVHYEFEFSPKELKLVFAKLLGFSMHFNKKEFGIHLESEVKGTTWDEAINIFDYATELNERAQKLIEEEEILPEFIWECPICGFDTFIIQDDINYCYVCGFIEDVFECPDCKNFYYESEGKQYLINKRDFEKICKNCFKRRTGENTIDYYDNIEDY